MAVGAGPAALAAAIVCARAGLRVTIVALARRAGIDVLTPSETLHPGIESLLLELGATDAISHASRGAYRGIWRNGVFALLGQDRNGPWIGHHVDRARFDAALLARATHLGAVMVLDRAVDIIQEGDRVAGVRMSAGAVYATYVVDGSGRQALFGRRLNFTEQVSSPPLLAWSALIDPHEQTDREPRFERKRDGWTWVAPEDNGLATWTRLVVASGSHILRPRIEEGSLAGKLVGKSVQWRLFRPLVSEGLVLVGDAAGIVDPGAGQGVFRALLTGLMAGRTIVAALSRPDVAIHLARYDAWFVDHYEHQTRRLREEYRF